MPQFGAGPAQGPYGAAPGYEGGPGGPRTHGYRPNQPGPGCPPRPGPGYDTRQGDAGMDPSRYDAEPDADV